MLGILGAVYQGQDLTAPKPRYQYASQARHCPQTCQLHEEEAKGLDLSRRVVPVPPPTLAALRGHRRRQKADQLAAGSAWQDTGLVFTTHLGGPLEPRNVNRSWYAIRSRAGLTGFRLHDLRHSCASFMLAAGASPRTVMKTMGHSQIGLTMNTYTHVLPEIERAAIDAAARTIFE